MSENAFFLQKSIKESECESKFCWAYYGLETGTWAKRGDNQTHTLWKIICGNFCCSKIRSVSQCETGIVSPSFFTSLRLFRVEQQWQGRCWSSSFEKIESDSVFRYPKWSMTRGPKYQWTGFRQLSSEENVHYSLYVYIRQ